MLEAYGASDDLIEIDGEFSEEFSCYIRDDNEKIILALSDGTVLDVKYTDYGVWRFTLVAKGLLYDGKEEGYEDAEGRLENSDVVRFKDGIKWAILGRDAQVARA